MIKFPKPKVEQFFQTYAITHFAVSDNEDRLIFNSNLNGKMNLWAMDLPDQFPYLFAQKDESCNFIKVDPENRYVLAGYDRDGDENYQIYAILFEGGLPQELITGKVEEKYYFAHLSEDGERVYYVTSEDNPSFLNARVRNLTTGEDKLINEGENSPTFLSAVSPEEQSFVYTRMFANTYSVANVYYNGEQVFLTPDPKKVHVTFSPVFTDEKTVYFITDYEAEFVYLAK